MKVEPPTQATTQAAPSKQDGAFKASEYHLQETSKAKGERDEDLALSIMKLAVKFHEASPSRDDNALVDTCERLWRWATGDTHKLPGDAPNG